MHARGIGRACQLPKHQCQAPAHDADRMPSGPQDADMPFSQELAAESGHQPCRAHPAKDESFAERAVHDCHNCEQERGANEIAVQGQVLRGSVEAGLIVVQAAEPDLYGTVYDVYSTV